MTEKEMKNQATSNYYSLCIAQVKALADAPTKEKRMVGLHYSEGLKDGYIECLRVLEILNEDEIKRLIGKGDLVTLFS